MTARINNLATGDGTQLLLGRNICPPANLNVTPNRLLLGIRLKEATFCELCHSRNGNSRPETAKDYFKGSKIYFRTRPHNPG
jgi:hypothetical protein